MNRDVSCEFLVSVKLKFDVYAFIFGVKIIVNLYEKRSCLLEAEQADGDKI